MLKRFSSVAVALLLLLSTTSWGQSIPLKVAKWEATKTADKALTAAKQSLAATTDGGYLLADQLTGEQTELKVGDYTYEGLFKGSGYLIKYNAEGQPAWSVVFHGVSRVDGLLPLKDGSTIVAVSYAGTMTAKQKGSELFQARAPKEGSRGVSFVKLAADGTMAAHKELPLKQEVESLLDDGVTSINGFVLDEAAGRFYCNLSLWSELDFGAKTIAPDAPLGGYTQSLLVEVVLSSADLSIVAAISYPSKGDPDKALAASAVSGIRHASSADGVTYNGFSLYGWVNEDHYDVAGNTSNTAHEYRKGTNADLSKARCIILRAERTGTALWEKEIAVQQNIHPKYDTYRASAHIRQLLLSPDGKKLMAFGLFQGKLTFPDNSTLESKKDGDTYATDAFVLVMDAANGNIIQKQILGFNSLGYGILVDDLTLTMPFQVATQFPHIYLATAYQRKVTIKSSSLEYNAIDLSDPSKLSENEKRYGTALVHFYFDETNLTPLEAFPMQTDSYFRVAGFVPGAPAHVKALGSFATKAEPTSLNLVGNPRSEAYDVDARYSFLADIDFSMPTTLTFRGMPDNLALDVAVNSGTLVTYTNANKAEFPNFQLSDSYTLTSKEYNHAPFEKYKLKINGAANTGSYRVLERAAKVEVVVSIGIYTLKLADNPLNEHYDIEFLAGADKTSATHWKPGEAELKIKEGDKLWVTVAPKVSADYAVKGIKIGTKELTLEQLANEGYEVTDSENEPLLVTPDLRALFFPVQLATSSKLEGAAVSVSSGAKPSEQLTLDKPATTFTVRQGDKVKIVCTVPGPDVLLQEVKLNGTLLEGDFSNGVEYTVPADTYELVLEVQAVKNPALPIVVTHTGDFTLGGLKVQVNLEQPVELKGDPAKYPALKAHKLDKLTVTALPSDKAEFKELTICGTAVKNGSTFEVPASQADNIPIKVTFVRKGTTPVLCQPLAEVETIVSDGQIRILGSWSTPLQVHIYNLLGVPVYTNTYAEDVQQTISLQGLQPGVYLLVLSNSEGQQLVRFVR